MLMVKNRSQLHSVRTFRSVRMIVAVAFGVVMFLALAHGSIGYAADADHVAERIALVEIRVEVDPPFEDSRLPKWDSVEIGDRTFWATSEIRELAAARVLTVVRTIVGDLSYRNQVHFAKDVGNPLFISGRPDLPALELRQEAGVLWVAELTEGGERVNKRVLRPGDRLETISWPGVQLIYHGYIPRDDILGFEIKAGIGDS